MGGPYTPGAMSARRRRLLLVAVAAIAVVLATEGGARLLAPYVTEPQRYGDDATAVKVAQMDELGADCIDVVLAGNSMGRDAFDPELFRAADREGRRAYNASLDAASPELLERWLTDEAVSRLRPDTVVLTLASLDVNASGPATRAALDAYDGAEQTRSDLIGRLGVAAGSVSELVAYRTELRDPSELRAALDRLAAGDHAERVSVEGIDGVLGAGGEGLSRRSLRYRGDAGAKAFTRQQLLRDWSLDPRQLDASSATIDELRAAGIDVVLVVLPVTSDYIDQHPGGEADFTTFLTAAEDLAASTGVALIDLHDAAPIEHFADTHHLNGEGTAWFSAELAARLDDLGLVAAPRCPE